MDSLAGEESGKAGAGCVIIGAGLAAAHAVQSLRERNYRGAIILIGEEPERPYERPPLSKEYLQGSKPREEVFVHAADWYEQHRVTTRFGTGSSRSTPKPRRSGCPVARSWTTRL